MKRSIEELEAYEAMADAWREELKLMAEVKTLIVSILLLLNLIESIFFGELKYITPEI